MTMRRSITTSACRTRAETAPLLSASDQVRLRQQQLKADHLRRMARLARMMQETS